MNRYPQGRTTSVLRFFYDNGKGLRFLCMVLLVLYYILDNGNQSDAFPTGALPIYHIQIVTEKNRDYFWGDFKKGAREAAVEMAKENGTSIITFESEENVLPMVGLDLMEWLEQKDSRMIRILLTCHQSFNYVVTAMRCGVFSYLLKPLDEKELARTIEMAEKELARRDAANRLCREKVS